MLSIKSVSGKDYLYQDGKRVTFVRSPHTSAGFADGEPRFLVMHYTGGSTAQSSVDWFADPLSKVSAHVTIERDGTLYDKVREANLPAGTELVQREVQGIWWYVTALDKAGNNVVDGWVRSSYLMAG